MKWKKLLSGAGMLGLCAAAAKLLGAFFRIPLTNIIGAEGIGLYQMVFPLYTVLLTVSSGGLSSAISKVIASRMAKSDERGANKILKVSVSALVILGGAAAVFLIIFRAQIAELQGNALASLAYLGIAPAIVFVAVISCLRGYFQGRGNMLPSGISQIVEQLVKLVLGLYLAARLLRYGITVAVLGAVLGVTLSELFAMLILLAQFLALYLKRRKKTLVLVRRIDAALEAGADFAAAPALPELRAGDILKNLYRIAIPVTLGSLIMPLTQVIDSVLVINVLTAGGMSRAAATSLFGLVSGPISSLINMPIAVMLSISIALLPKIAYIREKTAEGVKAEGNNAEGKKKERIRAEYNGAAGVTEDNSAERKFTERKRAESGGAERKFTGRNKAERDTTEREFTERNKAERTGAERKFTGRKKAERGGAERKFTGRNKAERDATEKKAAEGGASEAVSGAIRTTLLLSLPAAAIFMAFPKEIVTALYSRGLSAWQLEISSSLLRIESLSIFYISMIQIATAVLQGADKPHRPAINLLYGAVTKVLLTLLLLPFLGIRGAAAASVACYSVIAGIDLIYMLKIVKIRLSAVKAVVMPLAGCAILVGTGFLGLWAFGLFLKPLFATAAALILGAFSYGGFLLVTKSVSLKEFLR